MPEDKSTAPAPLRDFAPKLAELTDQVLFGDVWERPQLSPRDRSLVTVTVTVSVLAALYRTEQLNFPRPRPSTT
jgi:4-carboxymuconolactone decarboxylase